MTKTPNMPQGRDALATNERGLTAGNDQARIENTDGDHFTASPDPLKGWYSLAANVKASRTERKPKRGWKRKQGGNMLIEAAFIFGILALAMLRAKGVI